MFLLVVVDYLFVVHFHFVSSFLYPFVNYASFLLFAVEIDLTILEKRKEDEHLNASDDEMFSLELEQLNF